MTESSLLRLALIMEDQSATTVDKYICKLIECVLFYSDKSQFSAVELSNEIDIQFQLEFDVSEIETAVKRKSRGRIIVAHKLYSLSAKVNSQLSTQTDAIALLKSFISQFIKKSEKDYNESVLLGNIQEYLYHCFNSSADNLLSLLQNQPLKSTDSFTVSNELASTINEFIAWDNPEKNKLLYDIISFSYEYCMLTTKRDSLLSKNLFRGKRFFLDTNIIFRMAGINKDERQFVTNSFVDKCKEVKIELCYTSETLSELFRVVEGQIKYIKYITNGQPPIGYAELQKIDYNNEINDFYNLFCNWCKEPQNKYYDYLSFQMFLVGLIRDVIEDLTLVNITSQNVSKNADSFEKQCDSLNKFKTDKRPSKPNSHESLQADINNILHILSLRNSTQVQTIWQTNDFFVSADQMLTNWAKETYSGIPIVVIPSTWLSIILRFTGRTADDYKSYCLFMGLRQHKSEDDEININPIWLLRTLSEKTSDKSIKERIISEIVVNNSEYSFSTNDTYNESVERAFDKVLNETKEEIKREFDDVVTEKSKDYDDKLQDLSAKLKERSSNEEYAVKFANSKATAKVEKWKRLEFLQVLLPALFVITAITLVLIFVFHPQPLFDFIRDIFPKGATPGYTGWNFVTWASSLLVAAIPNVLIAPIKYLGSDNRKNVLIKKYCKEGKKYLENQ